MQSWWYAAWILHCLGILSKDWRGRSFHLANIYRLLACYCLVLWRNKKQRAKKKSDKTVPRVRLIVSKTMHTLWQFDTSTQWQTHGLQDNLKSSCFGPQWIGSQWASLDVVHFATVLIYLCRWYRAGITNLYGISIGHSGREWKFQVGTNVLDSQCILFAGQLNQSTKRSEPSIFRVDSHFLWLVVWPLPEFYIGFQWAAVSVNFQQDTIKVMISCKRPSLDGIALDDGP